MKDVLILSGIWLSLHVLAYIGSNEWPEKIMVNSRLYLHLRPPIQVLANVKQNVE